MVLLATPDTEVATTSREGSIKLVLVARSSRRRFFNSSRVGCKPLTRFTALAATGRLRLHRPSRILSESANELSLAKAICPQSAGKALKAW